LAFCADVAFAFTYGVPTEVFHRRFDVMLHVQLSADAYI